MRALRRLMARVGGFATRGRDDERLREEIAEHIELETAENIHRGMAPEEARRQAALKFGAVEAMKEEYRAERRIPFLETLAQDLRYGVRMLRKSPGFTAVVVLTLALGIGANTAIFSFVDAVLLRALPVKDPHQLVVLSWSARKEPLLNGHSGYGDCERGRDCAFSVPFSRVLREQRNTFSGVAAFAGPLDFDMSGNGPARVAQGTWVSGDFFSTLGVKTAWGRPLADADDSPEAPPAIVLDYGFWQRAFGGDRAAVGRTVRLNNVVVTIVGVGEPRFTSITPGNVQDFYMPLALADRVRSEWWGDGQRVTDPAIFWAVILGRLAPGVSLGQAQTVATTVFRNQMLHGSPPIFVEADAPQVTLMPARAGLNGETKEIAPALLVTMTIVGFILLIASANVAGLMLARSATRQREMALRLSLGAGRARIVRQLLTESLLLSLAGGVMGCLVAVWAADAIVRIFPGGADRPFFFQLAPDWRVLAFTLGVTLATGVLFGLAPALRGSRADLTPALKESVSSLRGRAAQAGRKLRLGDALVVAQVALSIVVLTGAGLLIRTLQNLHSIDPGFDTRNVLLFGIEPGLAGYSDRETQRLYGDLQRRLEAVPGVISASYSQNALLSGNWSDDDFHLDGAPPKQNISASVLNVGPDFLPTMRIPLLAGRTFTAMDFDAAAVSREVHKAAEAAANKSGSAPAPALPDAAAVKTRSELAHALPVPVIVNESFARTYFANQNPVGQHVGEPETEDPNGTSAHGTGYVIVGVAGDTKYAYLRREIEPMMYRPQVGNSASFGLRTAGNPTSVVKTVREIVARAGDNLPLTDLRTQTEQVEDTLFQERLLSRLSGFFGALALVLACVGLYGLLSYELARRTREIGIRMALGAQRRDIVRLVLGSGFLLVAIGCVAGIVASFWLTRYLATLLFAVKPADPLTFVAVPVLLAAVALVAAYVPARRAMRVDPMVALRYE